MSQDSLPVESPDVPAPEADLLAEPEPLPRAEPITSRFLFVDVAAQRAKQLRRGARPRVAVQADTVIKLERLAMQEVAEGVVLYSLPPPRTVPVGEGAA
jgi:DNA-directed RNA polymerase subunit K/omega